MRSALLFSELLVQIERATIERFAYCLADKSCPLDPIDIAYLKRILNPICTRLSLEPHQLDNVALNRLARSEWLEVCAKWMTHSVALEDLDIEQHHNGGTDFDSECVGSMINLFRHATIYILDEQSQIYRAAVDATRVMALLYGQSYQNRLFSDQFEPQRF